MAVKRKATGLSGILAVDKPAGISSHDVVNRVRQISGERRVGHAGTLDPLATGLLILGVGPATRLSDYLMAGVKTYEARICFGTSTNTDDAEGEVIETAALPSEINNAKYALHYLESLQGEFLQTPPAFSAIKKDGVTAYKAARAGEMLELEPRKVCLYEAQFLAGGSDYWDVALTVSKGFYVRSFARELGSQLNSAAHLGALRRTASGYCFIEQACSLEDLAEGGALPFIDPVAALGLPFAEINAVDAERVKNGRPLTLSTAQVQSFKKPEASGDSVVAPLGSQTPSRAQALISIVYKDSLLALYAPAGTSGLAHPKVVIPGGVAIPKNL